MRLETLNLAQFNTDGMPVPGWVGTVAVVAVVVGLLFIGTMYLRHRGARHR